MTAAGFWMLGALGALVLFTGIPVWALLLGVSSVAAGLGWACGAFDVAVLSSISGRLVSLFDNDLLQALPLYVLIGMLLHRLPLANSLFGSFGLLLRWTGAGRPLSVLAVGGLLAPMNGSVAASSLLLSRLGAARLTGLPAPQGVALTAAAATIGVVVPPSLVLLLLGDAMMRAHTEASNLPGYALGQQRIVNTQDVFQAALLPGVAVLVLWGVLAWAQARRESRNGGENAKAIARPPAAHAFLALLTVAGILGLLVGVFTGRLFAVEAAAAACCVLLLSAAVGRAFTRARWRELLSDTLSGSGALFALLVGATTFSLVFRLFGTDRWLTQLVLGAQWPPSLVAALVLLLVAACALVLDAFEMIFVVIPIVAPLLVLQMADPRQVAVLLLLVLQLSFLLPPMGYAVLLARKDQPGVSTAALLRALVPWLAAQLLVGSVVFAAPRTVHLLEAPSAIGAGGTPASMSEDDLVRQMREMAPASEAPASEPDDGQSPVK